MVHQMVIRHGFIESITNRVLGDAEATLCCVSFQSLFVLIHACQLSSLCKLDNSQWRRPEVIGTAGMKEIALEGRLLLTARRFYIFNRVGHIQVVHLPSSFVFFYSVANECVNHLTFLQKNDTRKANEQNKALE